MPDVVVLVCVAAIPLAGVALGISLPVLLLACLACLFCYGVLRGHAAKSLAAAALRSARPVARILFSFLLIGALTAIWRASGTIPYLVYLASGVCDSHALALASFLICCLFSVVTGTAFGTAATMGPICVAAAHGMGADVLVVGGAVLSGSYFGDRCSPVSTSALLVSSLTQTSLFGNILAMIRTSVVPFLLSCVAFLLLGMQPVGGAYDPAALQARLDSTFWLDVATLLPVAAMLVLSLLKVRVELLLAAGIATALPLALMGQGLPLEDAASAIVWGYSSHDGSIDTLLAGGGVLSMMQPLLIVCISSCSAGLLEQTGLLEGAKASLSMVARRAGSFASTLLVSVVTAMVACNQTLTILLTHRVCAAFDGAEVTALHLENSAVVVAALVPWSIASSVPLSAIGVSPACITYACYLYLVPLCFLAWGLLRRACPAALRPERQL